MQSGGYQTGGFDPGLLALIGTLVSGGIGGYGYTKYNEDAVENAKNSLSTAQKEIVDGAVKAQQDAVEKTATLEAEKKAANDRANKLQAEKDDLERKFGLLSSKTAATSGPVLAYQKATIETLGKAVDPTIEALRALPNTDYAWMKEPAPLTKLREALKYPVSGPGRLSRPSLSSLYTRVAAAMKLDAGLAGGRKRRYRSRMRGGANQIPTEEEFFQAYEKGINASTITAKEAVTKKSEEAKAKVDEKVQGKKNAAAQKAAGVLADKLDKTIAAAKKDIEKQESIVSILAPARREILQKTKTALQTKIVEATTMTEQLRSVTTEVDWQEKRGAAQALYEAIPKDAKAYVEEVKAAKKAEEKTLTDTGKRDLFKISFTMSVGNPFSALWSALNDPSKAYTESQKASKFREESGKVIEFIRKIYNSVAPTLKELEKVKKRRKGGRRQRGGAMDTAEEKCSNLIRIDKRYAYGDPGFLIDSLRAITTGGREPIDGTEWVPRKVTDSAKKSTLKYLLDRLNTGALASVSDYIRGAMGKDAQYTPEDAALAGEAYVLLRCYLEKAAEVVKTLKGSETVFQDLQSTLQETRAAAAATSAATSESKNNLDNARDGAKITIDNAVKELTDRDAKIRDVFAAVSMEIGRRPRRIADTGALEGVQADLLKAQKELSTFRTSDIHQKFISSEGIFEGISTVDVAPLQSKFDSRATTHKGQADRVYAIVDKSLEDAGRVAQSYANVAPDFAKSLGDLTGVPVASSNGAINPLFVARPPPEARIEMTSRPSAPPDSGSVTPAASVTGTGDPNSGRTTPRSEGVDTPIAESSVRPPPTPLAPLAEPEATVGDTGQTPAQLVTNVARPGQVLSGNVAPVQSLRNLVSPQRKGLNIVRRTPTVTVGSRGGKKTRRKGGRKSRKSTLKKRRGGK